MAKNNVNPGKKVKKWTQADEDILIKNIQKHVLCLKKGFKQTSVEIQRSPGAIANHWYKYTSHNCGRTLFATISGSHISVNRKNGKGQPLKLPLYKKVLAFLGLPY